MNNEEKQVLKAVVEHTSGLLSPATLINGIAHGNRRVVENLVVKGYLEEVPQDRPFRRDRTYSLNFYRITEKGIMQFAPGYKKAWFAFKNDVVLYIGLASMFIGISVAFGVPLYQKMTEEHAEIQAVYKNLVVNQDIFISNSNGVRELIKRGAISDLPELFIEDDISKDARKALQDIFGLVQYRFFLYYLQQTTLMNEEIKQMRDNFIASGVKSFAQLNSTKKYLATMELLNTEALDGELNYQKDTECLQYFFEYNFSYLTIDGRGKAPECSNGSLERLFNNLGYLPDNTPAWLVPQLKRMLDARESDLGDKIIVDIN